MLEDLEPLLTDERELLLEPTEERELPEPTVVFLLELPVEPERTEPLDLLVLTPLRLSVLPLLLTLPERLEPVVVPMPLLLEDLLELTPLELPERLELAPLTPPEREPDSLRPLETAEPEFLEDELPANLAELDLTAVAEDLCTSVRLEEFLVEPAPETLLLVGMFTLVEPERTSEPEPVLGLPVPLLEIPPEPLLPPGLVAEPIPFLPAPTVFRRGVWILEPPP